MLRAWDWRDRLSAISCVTLSPIAARPGLYFDVLDHNAYAEDVVTFLADLHRRLGQVKVVWYRSNIYGRSRAVRTWLARHPGASAEDFLGYGPDLNPDERVWELAKSRPAG